MLEVTIKKKIDKFMLDVHFNHTGHVPMGILGASGCGKSMTLKCIAGIVKPDQGRIVLNGKVLFDSEKKINLIPQKRKVGYLFQNYALFPNMTIRQNIAIGIPIKDKTKKGELTASLLNKFHLNGLENRFPYELSGGQQQRAALIRILANEPDIIMLDEPFSALDSFLKEELQREIDDILKEYKGEIIMVSHSRDEIFKLTKKLAIMDSGRILRYDDTKNVFLQPDSLEAARLTGCKNISLAVKVGERQVKAVDWNLILNVSEAVPENISYIGIRAHHIELTQDSTQDNTFDVDVTQLQELPFDTNYIVKNSMGCQKEIWVKVSKSNIESELYHQNIKTIRMPPEKLLLLKSSS